MRKDASKRKKSHPLIRFRERHFLRQKYLAEMLGISIKKLCEWESGRVDPPSYIYYDLDWIAEQLTKHRSSHETSADSQ